MWIKDPKTKERSVTLTLCIITGVIALVGAVMEFLGKGVSPNAAVDLFWGSLATYTARKFKFGSKDFDAKSE